MDQPILRLWSGSWPSLCAPLRVFSVRRICHQRAGSRALGRIPSLLSYIINTICLSIIIIIIFFFFTHAYLLIYKLDAPGILPELVLALGARVVVAGVGWGGIGSAELP